MTPQPGIYEHYKGDLYLVVFDRVPNSTDSTTFGRHNTPSVEHFPMTVYISLTQARGKPVIHARESRQFHQEVCGKRGCEYGCWGKPPTPHCVEYHGDRVQKRFEFVRSA